MENTHPIVSYLKVCQKKKEITINLIKVLTQEVYLVNEFGNSLQELSENQISFKPCSSSTPLSSKAGDSGSEKKIFIEKVKPSSISGGDLTLSENITVATIPIVENGLSTISSTKTASSSLVKEISRQNYEAVQSQVAFLNTVITVSEHKQTHFSCYTVEGKPGEGNSLFEKTTSYFKKFKSNETLSYIISKTINRLFLTLSKSFFKKINIVTNSNTIQEMIMDLNNKPGSLYSTAKSREFYIHTKNIINEGKIEEVNVITCKTDKPKILVLNENASANFIAKHFDNVGINETYSSNL
uniref:Uncharacterized protein n=1 Tax=Strongyloides papillosus TaxID=174720 RepID=A0A0N5C6I2_STREA